MANCVIVLGASGTGKSTSVRGLDPKETVIINVLGKRLPFRDSGKMYAPELGNIFTYSDHGEIISLLEKIGSGERIRNVVIDDAVYIMRKEYFRRTKEKGYDKFTELAMHFQSVIQACERLRDGLNIFFLLHAEEVVSDGAIVSYQVSTVGKLLLSQYNPVECVPMVLFSGVVYDEAGNAGYGFYTRRTRADGVEIPAKTPEGMFDESFMPNDLGLVSATMDAYYGVAGKPEKGKEDIMEK